MSVKRSFAEQCLYTSETVCVLIYAHDITVIQHTQKGVEAIAKLPRRSFEIRKLGYIESSWESARERRMAISLWVRGAILLDDGALQNIKDTDSQRLATMKGGRKSNSFRYSSIPESHQNFVVYRREYKPESCNCYSRTMCNERDHGGLNRKLDLLRNLKETKEYGWYLGKGKQLKFFLNLYDMFNVQTPDQPVILYGHEEYRRTNIYRQTWTQRRS